MCTVNKILMIVLAGILGMASAQASVVYEWQPVAGTDRFDTTSGQLVFTDAAYRSGALNYGYERTSAAGFPLEPGLNYFPDSPILSMAFELVFPLDDGDDLVFNLSDTPTESDRNSGFSARMDLAFMDALLTGSLGLNDEESNFNMSSADDGDLWTITSFNSDRLIEYGGCDLSTRLGCDGATGRWVLASAAPSDVPSPAVWGLFLLAVLGTLGLGTARLYRAVHHLG